MTPAKWIAVAVLGLPLASFAADVPKDAQAAPTPPAASREDQGHFRENVRALWADHAFWLHSYIVSSVASLPDVEAIRQRMLKNEEDIARSLQPALGDETADGITSLLKEQQRVTLQLVDAARAGDNRRIADVKNRWNANADQIAGYLHGADRQDWVQADVKAILDDELKATIDQVDARVSGHWDEDLSSFQRLQSESSHMADLLIDGIQSQQSRQSQDRPVQ